MKNKALFKYISSITGLLIIILFSACFSPYTGSSDGTIIINFSGNTPNSSRNAIPWPPNNPDNFIMDEIDYIIILTGDGETKQFEIKGGDNFNATVSAGWWDVNIKAYYPDKDTLYAEGDGGIDVKTQENNSVLIQMIKAFEDTYTVIFDSMGGTEISPITGILEGEIIPKPVNPFITGYNSKFISWLLDGVVFDFSTPITENIILTANWSFYTVGETGPGGGIIFHADPSGFPLQGETPSYTAHYLEAAPSSALLFGNTDAIRLFDPNPSPPLTTNPTLILERGIGAGKGNTERIIAWAAANTNGVTSSPAANYCAGFFISGYENINDWFLPSIDELELLFSNLHEAGLETYPVEQQGAIHSSSWRINDLEYGSEGIVFLSATPGEHVRINFFETNWVIPVRGF